MTDRNHLLELYISVVGKEPNQEISPNISAEQMTKEIWSEHAKLLKALGDKWRTSQAWRSCGIDGCLWLLENSSMDETQ